MSINFSLYRLFSALIMAALVLNFSACSSDDDNNPSPNPDNPGDETYNPFVVSLAVQGTEGDFTYYTVPFKNVMNGTLDAEGQGIEQPGYYDFTQIDNTIYSIGGLDDVDMVGIRKDEANKTLKTVGEVSFDNSLSDLKKAEDNTLVSVTMDAASNVITFRTFNKNALSVTGQIDRQVSDLGDFTGNEGPAYSGMAISGDHLYLSYYITDSETFATNHTDTARVAVYSYPDFEFEKVMTDTRVGPIGGFNVKGGLTKDEDGNIYAISHSNPANGFSQSTKPSGILKINSGETSFDPDYFFDIKDASSGGNTAHLVYLGHDKAFAEINTADRSSQEGYADGPLRSAMVDLNAQTVKFINGIPEHKGTGRRLSLLQTDDAVYLTAPDNSQGLRVYKVEKNTHNAVKGAKIQANFAAGIFKL